MKFCGRTQMFPQYSLVESLAMINQLGFDGAEICVEKLDWTRHDLASFPVAEIKRQTEVLGLAPVSFSFHQDYLYDDEVFALLQQAIRLTPSLDTRTFIFGGAKKRTGGGNEWGLMIERTRRLVAIAEECGVVLAEEFEPGFVVGSTAELLRLFEEIPSSHLAANLDLGHLFLCDPDPLDSIGQVGGRIAHCHISNMPRGVHDHEIPQKGDMDLRAYLRTLHEVGFAGGLALDLYKYDYETVAPEALACLRTMLAEAVVDA